MNKTFSITAPYYSSMTSTDLTTRFNIFIYQIMVDYPNIKYLNVKISINLNEITALDDMIFDNSLLYPKVPLHVNATQYMNNPEQDFINIILNERVVDISKYRHLYIYDLIKFSRLNQDFETILNNVVGVRFDAIPIDEATYNFNYKGPNSLLK